MTGFQRRLFDLRDADYAAFCAKLTPTLAAARIIGVRTPQLRKLARELYASPERESFMDSLPHEYYEENNLHAFFIEQTDDYGACVAALARFLPYVDNWAPCDMMSPRVFRKHRAELVGKIKDWLGSGETYTQRFAIGLLMSHYLDGDFSPEYPALVAPLRSDEYYVNMMIAWYFATALAKQYDATLPYIEGRRLAVWTHNKAIQKARESCRVSDEHKVCLQGLKIKRENNG